MECLYLSQITLQDHFIHLSSSSIFHQEVPLPVAETTEYHIYPQIIYITELFYFQI